MVELIIASSEEIVALKMPGKSYMDMFDDKVRELHSNGIGLNKIARELGVSSRTIRMILDGKKEKHSKNYKTTPGVKKKDWNDIDEATLPIIQEIKKKSMSWLIRDRRGSTAHTYVESWVSIQNIWISSLNVSNM